MSQYGAYGFAKNGSGYRDILAHYYTGTAIGNLDPASRVRVLLQSTAAASFTGATRAGRRRLSRAQTYYVRRRGALGPAALPAAQADGHLPASCASRGRGGAVRSCGGRAANGRVSGTYRGALDFRAGTFSGVDAVNSLPLDSYLRGVVPDESPPSWPIEALKAQAVAARTYAVATMKPGATFDLYPDTRSQVYGGVAAEVASTNQAVERHPRRGRHLQRPAGRHVLLLDLRRAHRGRREHAAGQRAAAVAEVGRRSLRRHLPAPPLGPDPDEPQAGRRQARLRRQGRLPRHRGRAPRPLAADRGGRRDRHPRAHPRDRRAAARALRPVRLVGVLHLDHDRRRAAARSPRPRTRRADRRHRSVRVGRRCSAATGPSAPSPGACCRCCAARA